MERCPEDDDLSQEELSSVSLNAGTFFSISIESLIVGIAVSSDSKERVKSCSIIDGHEVGSDDNAHSEGDYSDPFDQVKDYQEQ